MDFLNGGMLSQILEQELVLDEKWAKIYVAEIVCALEALHNENVVYRDLKPDNIILDSDGHICLTDFGLSKQNIKRTDRTYSYCGTPEYLAPEIILCQGHSQPVDWWSLGALLY